MVNSYKGIIPYGRKQSSIYYVYGISQATESKYLIILVPLGRPRAHIF